MINRKFIPIPKPLLVEAFEAFGTPVPAHTHTHTHTHTHRAGV